MAKRKETLEIEKKLNYMCYKRRIYGCEEVTIGFYHSGRGNEIVDYCTMDSKGILRCYEIKVSLADLKSKAKKSWYGHYNYLLVTEDLYHKIYGNFEAFIPDFVGIAIPCNYSWSDGIEIKRNAKKQHLSPEQETMLKESMVRSLYYKMTKHKEASDIETISKLKSELRRCEKDRSQYSNEAANLRFVVSRMERALRLYYGWEVNLEDLMLQISERKLKLPENVELMLTERGKEYNQKAEELKDIEKLL